MTEERSDVLTQFQNISNKLKKKRMLKKPNIGEVSQSFENLGITCEREELPQYAGLCYQAAAKNQNTLGNHSEEAHLLLKSSRQFMASHLKLESRKIVATGELLHHALTCYQECSDRFKSNIDPAVPNAKELLGGITLEMGSTLQNQIYTTELAMNEYRKALELFSLLPVEKIFCLQKLLTCKIELGDYNESLKLTNEIIEETQNLPASGVKEDILLQSEINRILLLLILQPTPQQITPSTAQILEKYAWVEAICDREVIDLQTTLNNNGLSMLSEELFLCLQSLVMACQSNDSDSLILLEDDLINYLNNEQKNLLRILVKQMLERSKES